MILLQFPRKERVDVLASWIVSFISTMRHGRVSHAEFVALVATEGDFAFIEGRWSQGRGFEFPEWLPDAVFRSIKAQVRRFIHAAEGRRP